MEQVLHLFITNVCRHKCPLCCNKFYDIETRNQSVIFTVSLSNTQVRVFIEPLGQKCQQYFIYRHATEETAQKVIKKIDDFLANMKVWQGFKNKTT